MADLKISQLTGATTPLAGTEVVPLVQSSTTKKVAVSDLTAGRAVSMASATVSGDLTVDTDTLKVDSTNNRVGLGTATPNSILDIVANTNTVRIGRSTTSYSTIDSNSSAGSLSITADAGGLLGGGTMRLYVSTVECVKLDSAGGITATTGNIIQGTAAKGVNFTANTPAAGMTSQLLNWYEEGTWTPTIGGTATYSAQGGKYTRVGRMVTAQATVLINAIGTGSTNTISGLPFTSIANIHGCAIGYFNNSATNVVSLMGYVPSSSTTIIMQGLTVAAASITSPITFFQNGTYLEISVTYQCV